MQLNQVSKNKGVCTDVSHMFPTCSVSLGGNPPMDLHKDADGTFKLLPLAPSSELKKPFKGAVYIVGDCFRTNAERLWTTRGYELVKDIQDSDIVCWLGGADINPKLYGEKKCGASYWDDEQDRYELKMLDLAGDRFKVGICRGAQLLNCIPNKGSLWQHTDGHSAFHKVRDVLTDTVYTINSIHHQQLRLTDKAELVAYTNISTHKECEKFTWYKGQNHPIAEEPLADKDVEAAFYPETKSLLIQWHPEIDGQVSVDYFHSLVERYYLAA